MREYQIFTDATADLSMDMTAGLTKVRIIPMQLEIGGQSRTYGPGGDITAEEFYELQRAGNFAHTSAISPSTYFEFFEPCLQAGKDILYLGFSSGLSSTVQSARFCAAELEGKYPERRIVCIDTLCASVGEGFLVLEAARMQDRGLTIEQLTDWIMERRLKVCHWFTVDVFEHLKRGGRVNAATAAVGTVLQIKPLLRVDENGELKVMEKHRGRKLSIAAQIKKMEQGWTPKEGNLVIVGHGSCPEGAEMLRGEIGARFPQAEIYTAEIGPIIGAHTGPGMLALVYWGTNR